MESLRIDYTRILICESDKQHLNEFLHTECTYYNWLIFYFKRTYSDTRHKQPVSFTRASTPLGLLVYVQKDNEYTVNMPQELYTKLMAQAKAKRTKTSTEIIRDCFLANRTRPYWAEATVRSLLDAVSRKELLSMPRRQKFFLIGFQTGCISAATYMRSHYGDFPSECQFPMQNS